MTKKSSNRKLGRTYHDELKNTKRVDSVLYSMRITPQQQLRWERARIAAGESSRKQWIINLVENSIRGNREQKRREARHENN